VTLYTALVVAVRTPSTPAGCCPGSPGSRSTTADLLPPLRRYPRAMGAHLREFVGIAEATGPGMADQTG